TTTQLYILSLHDALPICPCLRCPLDALFVMVSPHQQQSWADATRASGPGHPTGIRTACAERVEPPVGWQPRGGRGLQPRVVVSRSEEHTSELQLRENFVC